jgi:hypothetical protein
VYARSASAASARPSSRLRCHAVQRFRVRPAEKGWFAFARTWVILGSGSVSE